MKKTVHKSATASHYDKEAASYDAFNEKASRVINETITRILKKYRVKTVLDLSCGTGSQVFWLNKQGFDVSGCDINQKMLRLARQKAKQQQLAIKFSLGDMRHTQTTPSDAVLTIFNAIGHLTKSDFKKALRNIYKNLKPGGLYVFDIFNLNYLLDKDNITQLTIDWQKNIGNKVAREIQYSTIDQQGVLTSYDLYLEVGAKRQTKTSTAVQTLQVYNAAQLKELLNQAGFKVVRQCNIDGSRFSDRRSDRALVVAQKIHENPKNTK